MRLFVILSCFLLLNQLPAVDVYFGTIGRDAEGVYRAKFDPEKGKLSELQLAAPVDRPGFLAFHPERHTLYAVARSEKVPSVVAYRILVDGALERLNAVPTNDDNGAHIAVHPSGKFLMTAQYRNGSVALFPIAADGQVGERSQWIQHEGGSGVVPHRQSAPHPHWVGFSPDGRFALVPDLGTDQIVVYRVNPDSPQLEPAGFAETVPGGGPRHLRFSRDGRFVYLLNELTLSVTTFGYDPQSGALERLSTTPTLSEAVKAKELFNSASEILVHPNGRFIYTGNRGNDSVTVFEANLDTGELSVVEVEPIRGSWPRNISMDGAGAWLFAAGMRSNTVSIFTIDPETGELSFPAGKIMNAPSVSCILVND